MTELLGADTDALDRAAESLSVDARRLQDIGSQVQRAVSEMRAVWDGDDLRRLAQHWERELSPHLAGASATLDSCASQLRAQANAQRAASRSEVGYDGSSPSLMASAGVLGIPTVPPPLHSLPGDNASWWRSLSEQERRRVTKDQPDWIGNRDGVPFTARNEANRAMLAVDRARLVAERQRLTSVLAGTWLGGTLTNDDEALAHVDDKLASLDAIEQTLARQGDRQLLALDLSHERAEAAIARGNVDNADNVAVFVPGMDSNVDDDMLVYDRQMDRLQHRAELESKRVNPALNQTTATVTWIGYQTPQLGWDLLGEGSVADDRAAKAGAAQLVPFLSGIGAARSRDTHLSLLGHSYGSTTAGFALRQSTGVDDVVFFGSPGVGTSDVLDLSVPKGHAFYIEAALDPVGDLAHFGIDPSHMDGIEHASARESIVVDPLTGEIRHFKEVTGHSSYLIDDSTSQYNMSVVVAGFPERRVVDRGEGLGDVLSWPLPGTY